MEAYWKRAAPQEMLHSEELFYKQDRVSLYDGDRKTDQSNGMAEVTSHRVIWKKDDICLSLPLSYVHGVYVDEGKFLSSDKVVLLLAQSPDDIDPNRYVKLSCKVSAEDLATRIKSSISQARWKVSVKPRLPPAKKEIRSGISGIEKKLQAKSVTDQQNISQAFQDLDRLMEMAKPMVQLANSISTKIKERQGEITEDETVQFKSYLLSLGIDDPVTKKSAGSDKKFHQGLAREMVQVLTQRLNDVGGMMTLTDAFVLINRARGLELVSPDDVRKAAEMLNEMNLSMRTETLPSGAICLISNDVTQAELMEKTVYLVEAFQQMSPEQLAKELNIAVFMALERLHSAVVEGRLVCDRSVGGSVFYPNKFLTEPVC